MTALVIALIVVWAISCLALVVLVLMHSGKGTGVSDMIANTMYNAQTGTSLIERNLDRITLVFAIIFALCVLAMMMIYPLGTVS